MFRRNVVYVLRANVVVQLLALASAPLLSRIYTPDEFGQFGLFSASLVIAASFTTARLDWSIPNARSSATAATLFALGIVAIAGTSLGSLAILACMRGSDGGAISDLGAWIWLIPLGMVGLGLVELFNGWFVRESELRPVSNARIYLGLTNIGVSIAAGLIRPGAAGLVIATLAATWISIVSLVRDGSALRQAIGRVSLRRMRLTLRRVWIEALLSTSVSFVNAVNASIAIVLLATWFGFQEVGWYSLMLRLAAAPIGLIASAIGQGFWARAAELARQQRFPELRGVYLQTTRRLMVLAVPISVGCGLAPFLVGPIFGRDEWTPAGYVLLAMLPQLLGTAIFSPTNHLVVYGRQGYQLISDMTGIGLSALSIWGSAHWQLGIVTCTFLVSLSILIGYMMRFCFHLRANTESDRRRHLL